MTDKFVTPEPLPSEHEREILNILIEECAEVQQRATKLLRFGRGEIQPGQMLTNGFRLGMEIGDLMVMISRTVGAGITTDQAIQQGREQKERQLAKFMQTGA